MLLAESFRTRVRLPPPPPLKYLNSIYLWNFSLHNNQTKPDQNKKFSFPKLLLQRAFRENRRAFKISPALPPPHYIYNQFSGRITAGSSDGPSTLTGFGEGQSNRTFCLPGPARRVCQPPSLTMEYQAIRSRIEVFRNLSLSSPHSIRFSSLDLTDQGLAKSVFCKSLMSLLLLQL